MEPKWQAVVKTKASVLFQWYVFEGHKRKYYKQALGLDFGLKNQKIVADEISIDLNEFAELGKILAGKVHDESDFVKGFVKNCYLLSDRLLGAAMVGGKGGDLLKRYLDYQEANLNLMPYMNTILVMDGIVKSQIVEALVKELGLTDKTEQDSLISKLVIPKKKSFFVAETEAILALAAKESRDNDISGYLDKYAWLSSVAFQGKFADKLDVVARVESLVAEGVSEKLIQIKDAAREAEEGFASAMEKIKKSPRMVSLIDDARELLYLQTYRLDVFFLAFYKVFPMFEEIGKLGKISGWDVAYMTGEEIEQLIKNRMGVGSDELAKRQVKYALICEKGKMTLLSGEKVIEGEKDDSKLSEVRGVVGNRGRVTGTVKLVFGVEDMWKVNKGDILVSTNTIPQLVPAMVKSSGIVTDVGGMLSHAAIVSREFGIPCIVGTGNATKVFKDGDKVEVNAYDGVARKI